MTSPASPMVDTIVWLEDEHDLATAAALTDTFDRAIVDDDTDIVADLSSVRFMDASTVAVLMSVRMRLARQSRALQLRSPSTRARRVLDLCDVAC